MSSRIVFAVLALTTIASSAHARKFDFNSERFATYFGGTFGNSIVGNTPFGTSSGAGVTTDGKSTMMSSGELGFLISGDTLNLKLGAEVLMPKRVSGAKGKNASGTEYFTLDSKVTAITPMANVEALAYKTPTSRVLVGVGYGIALVSLENTYDLNANGEAAFSGVSDHTENAKAKVPLVQAYVGYETLFTDTVTAALTAGYRHARVPELASTQGGTSFSGSQTTGEPLKNMDGGNRTMDLGGGFVGVNFRFYIGL